MEAVGIRGSWRWAKEVGILCDWLGAHIQLSLIGPKLEVGSKIRVAIGYESSPGCLGPIVTGVVVRLPGCLLETVV